MFSAVRFKLTRAALFAGLLTSVAGVASAQTQEPVDRTIVKRTPNVIKSIGAFGTEMAIESDVIVERTPCVPEYPKSSVRNGETGTVKLQLLFNTSGYIIRAKAVETSGFKDLDRAAMIGFLGCKFKPRLKDGVPTETWADLTYVWSLEDEPAE